MERNHLFVLLRGAVQLCSALCLKTRINKRKISWGWSTEAAAQISRVKSRQISKILPLDAAIYVEKWSITVSNLWQIDPGDSGCHPSSSCVFRLRFILRLRGIELGGQMCHLAASLRPPCHTGAVMMKEPAEEGFTPALASEPTLSHNHVQHGANKLNNEV